MIYHIEEIMEEIKVRVPRPDDRKGWGEEPYWLRFAGVCTHDGSFLCSCRYDYLMKNIKNILEERDK